MDFPNIIGWRAIVEVNWNLEHWMHWCECDYAVFRWKLWIGLKDLTLEIWPKTGGLCLWSWSWMMIKCIMQGTYIILAHHFYRMYFFNIARHHIIFICNTRRPQVVIFCEVLHKSLSELWVMHDYVEALHIEMHVHTSNLNNGFQYMCSANHLKYPNFCCCSWTKKLIWKNLS